MKNPKWIENRCDRFHDQPCLWTFSNSVINITEVIILWTKMIVLPTKIEDSKYIFILKVFHLHYFHLVLVAYMGKNVRKATDTIYFCTIHALSPLPVNKIMGWLCYSGWWSVSEDKLNYTITSNFLIKK